MTTTCTLECDNWPIRTEIEAFRYIEHVVNDHEGTEQ